MTRAYHFIRRRLSRSIRWAWRNLPFSEWSKQKFKSMLFSRLPLIFCKTQAYRRWRDDSDAANHIHDLHSGISSEHLSVMPEKAACNTFAFISLVNGHKGQSLVSETMADLKNILEPDLRVVPCIETVLEEKKLLESSPWIGFVHSMPARVPDWLAELSPYDAVSNGALFSTDVWKRAKQMCQGLFVQSLEHAQQLRPIAGVPVHPLRSSLPKVERKWSCAAFTANTDKKIIQLGWWMQRAHGINLLPAKGMEKIWIKGPDPVPDAVMMAERQHLKDRHILFDFMLDSVTTIADPDSEEWVQLLEKNIVFVHLYNANNLDLVLECIAGHIPILINPYTAVREYLGNDYPLYYYFYKDAAEKAADKDLVQKAHEHLRQMDEKYNHGPEEMAKKIKRCIEETAN